MKKKSPSVESNRESWRVRLGQRAQSMLYAVRTRLQALPANQLWDKLRLNVDGAAIADYARRRYTKDLPELAVTAIHPPTLLILMGGTTIAEYDRAGQVGRLSSALERYARHYRTVLLMTPDSKDFTVRLDVPRVRHLTMPTYLPVRGSAAMSLATAMRFRSIRHASVVNVMDEQAASAGWLASKLSDSPFSISLGVPWSAPR